MENGITYVGVDAHKKDLFVAMLVGDQRRRSRGKWRTNPTRCVGSSASSSVRPPVRCGCVTKRGPAAMRCSDR